MEGWEDRGVRAANAGATSRGGRRKQEPKGAEIQKGASDSEPWGCCVYLQTVPSFEQIEQQPPGALGVAMSSCCSHHLADRTRETMGVCPGPDTALQWLSGLGHHLICPGRSGLGPVLVLLLMSSYRTGHWAGTSVLSVIRCGELGPAATSQKWTSLSRV